DSRGSTAMRDAILGFFEMVKRAKDGIAHGGAAPGINAFKGFFELGNAAGEILIEVEIEIVVDVDDESFILGIAGLDYTDGSFVDARALVAHAAAIVDHQPHAYGHVLAFEDGQFLFGFIFKDAKIFRLEPIGEALTIINNGRMQDDQVDVHLDAGTLFAGVGILTGGRRRGYGNLCTRAGGEYSRSANQERKMAQRKNQTQEELSGWGR